jgi:hypothetical protein
MIKGFAEYFGISRKSAENIVEAGFVIVQNEHGLNYSNMDSMNPYVTPSYSVVAPVATTRMTNTVHSREIDVTSKIIGLVRLMELDASTKLKK